MSSAKLIGLGGRFLDVAEATFASAEHFSASASIISVAETESRASSAVSAVSEREIAG